MKTLLLTFSLLLFCSASYSAEDLFDVADDVCSCFSGPYEFIESAINEIDTAKRYDDQSSLNLISKKLDQHMVQTTSCFQGLNVKYPIVGESNMLQGIVMEIAHKQCPNPARKYLNNF